MAQFPHPIYDETVLRPAYHDAQTYLFEPMLAAHEAHATMLAECQIISDENKKAILAAVAQIRKQGIAAYAYQPGVEDLFFRIEAAIIEVAGADFGGNLQLARSRNDLGQALARMALRTQVHAVSKKLLALRQSVHGLAQQHVETLMPGYTHTQPAQPVTFAHYLAGMLTFLAKDQARFGAAYRNVNESPLGAAAFTGSGFPIDRQRVAELLGFDSVIESTHHSIGAGDHLTDIAFAVQSLAIGLSRVTKDLIFLATQEAGALHIDDSFIQISSIMPQKRNPVVLEHLRARLSRALGAAQTIVTQALFDTLELKQEHLQKRAGENFTTTTELADTLVREAGLPFRSAHKVVATMVQQAIKEGEPLTIQLLQEAAQTVLGDSVGLSEEQFAQALDPHNFVKVRRGFGGVSPVSTGALLERQAEMILIDRVWWGERTG